MDQGLSTRLEADFEATLPCSAYLCLCAINISRVLKIGFMALIKPFSGMHWFNEGLFVSFEGAVPCQLASACRASKGTNDNARSSQRLRMTDDE